MATGRLPAIQLRHEPVRVQVWVFAVSIIERVPPVKKGAIAQFLVTANNHLIAIEPPGIVAEKIEPCDGRVRNWNPGTIADAVLKKRQKSSRHSALRYAIVRKRRSAEWINQRHSWFDLRPQVACEF